ncbi:type IV secretion system DNA-binding domain-containing protein [Mucilaginibacter sp.]|uniref:type IV secretory system conjugative DNA transfer family protein n=1 Tax=Mucilaginibacter sp. TaxID=1882438 RepID=UPI002602588D|nr:type IV secretion system DNA-binding domain-containing protein [Mucilaginibacter sp.]MDB4921226.1 hypothetical protein [Mucilaginibacter sp.]
MEVQSTALTEQFYEWENRGRGWFITDHIVELEPAFEPFWEHSITGDIIDDGKRPSWFSSLFAPDPPAPVQTEPTQNIRSFPDTKSIELSVFSVSVPKGSKQSLEQMEQVLIMLSYRHTPMSFELVGSADRITMQWTCRQDDEAFVYTQLKAFFPDVQIRSTAEDHLFEMIEDAPCVYTVDFGLQEEFMRPLATTVNLDHDPYTSLFGSMERLHDEQHIAVQVLFAGTCNAWSESMLNAVCDDSRKQSFFLDAPDMPTLTTQKIARPLVAATIRIVTASATTEDALHLLQHAAISLVHASTSPYNALVPLAEYAANPRYPIAKRLSDLVLRQTHRTGMLLNSRELLTFVHYPGPGLKTAKVIDSARTTKAAPDSLRNEAYCLGMNIHQGIAHVVGISPEQRLRHIHIMGATGQGKSTLLHALIMQDICAGDGCMVLDPHGDLIAALLVDIPLDRVGDVVLIDPADSEHPIGFNILSAHSALEKELLASDLVMVFKRFSTSWGDQMHSVLANAILALLYNKNVYHIGDLRRFLIEPAYRATILTSVTDDHIVYYWHKEFPLLKGGSIGSLLTRLDSFLRPKAIRSMLCQTEGLDMATLMDTRKIILVKLSHGLIGAENSYLLGAFIVSKLQQTAMARQAQSATNRIPFYCYIDEFQHFVTPSMAAILSGARKYGLGLILAHQDMHQVTSIDPDIASSVVANAGTRMCFRLGDTDAKRMQDGFRAFTTDDLQNLSIGDAIVRVGAADNDFNCTVMPYRKETGDDYTADILAYSRAQYCVSSIPPEEPAAPEDIPAPPPVAPPASPAPSPEPTIPPPSKEALREHRYLQTFIKKLAEEHGYTAQLEAPVPGGSGQIDVVLQKGEMRIAVEISVTNSPEYELHNIEKCLGAGFAQVVVCSTNARKRAQIERLVNEHIPQQEHHKISYVTPDEFITVLAPESAHPTHTVMKGYRVKVQYDAGGVNKQDVVRSIIKNRVP